MQTESELREEQAARDMLIQHQPILWAQGMLEAAEQCRLPDARDAILARVGSTLLGRFGVILDEKNMRKANGMWVRDA